MSRSSSSSKSHVNQLRQQLILDQVLIMELEDQREEIAPQLKQTEQLLDAAQTLVERKTEEAEHITKVWEDLQKQYEHLQHIQHVTHTALEEVRTDAANKRHQIDALLNEVDLLQTLIRQLSEENQSKQQTIASLQTDLAASHEQTSQHVTRIEELDQERRKMRSSRSWRWTTWLRAIERHFK